MMAGPLPLNPPSRLGSLLAERRIGRNQTLADLAEQAARLRLDISRNELWSIEHGLITVDDSKLSAILALYRLPAGGSFDSRARLVVDLEDGLIWAGNHQAELGDTRTRDEVLQRYVALLYVLRNQPPGERLPLRLDDLDILAATFDTEIVEIEERLLTLMDDGDAARSFLRLQSRIRVPAAGLLVGVTRVGALVITQQAPADGNDDPTQSGMPFATAAELPQA